MSVIIRLIRKGKKPIPTTSTHASVESMTEPRIKAGTQELLEPEKEQEKETIDSLITPMPTVNITDVSASTTNMSHVSCASVVSEASSKIVSASSVGTSSNSSASANTSTTNSSASVSGVQMCTGKTKMGSPCTYKAYKGKLTCRNHMNTIHSTQVATNSVSSASTSASSMPCVLEPCKIPASVDIEYLKHNVQQYMESRKEFYKETGRKPYIEDEFSEYWIAKASKGVQIGMGSGGMDVKTSIGEGIDVMCVIMNSNGTNEKSLMQNFSNAGADLDTLFREKKGDEALLLYLNGYADKIKGTKDKHTLNDLFILSFVSTQTSVYVICFKLNIDQVKNVKSTGFTKAEKNITTVNYIDELYGNVKLYKSKKRLELRLSKSCLDYSHAIKLYSLPAKE